MTLDKIKEAILIVAAAWLPAKVVLLVGALIDLAFAGNPINLAVAPPALKAPILRLIRESISKMPNPIARRVLLLVFDRLGEALLDAAWDRLFPEPGVEFKPLAQPAFDVDTIQAFDEVENHVGNLLAA